MAVILAEATPDAQWFYSSLAQSTAAIVSVTAAFLLFLVQRYETRLEAAELACRTSYEVTEVEQVPSAARLDELYAAADLRAHSAHPPVTVWLSLVLVILLVLGCGIPLMLLPQPDNGSQALFVGGLGAILGSALVAFLVSSLRAWARTQNLPVPPVISLSYSRMQRFGPPRPSRMPTWRKRPPDGDEVAG